MNPSARQREGLVDFPAVLGILRRAGFEGPLCLEKVPGREVFEVERNLEQARGFMEDLVDKTAPGKAQL